MNACVATASVSSVSRVPLRSVATTSVSSVPVRSVATTSVSSVPVRSVATTSVSNVSVRTVPTANASTNTVQNVFNATTQTYTLCSDAVTQTNVLKADVKIPHSPAMLHKSVQTELEIWDASTSTDDLDLEPVLFSIEQIQSNDSDVIFLHRVYFISPFLSLSNPDFRLKTWPKCDAVSLQ